MGHRNCFKVILVTVLAAAGLSASASGDLKSKAMQIHSHALVIDGHNDLPWRLREEKDLSLTQHDLLKSQPQFHTDIPRLRTGGVGAQFWSAYVPASLMDTGEAVKVTKEQILLIRKMVDKYPQTFELALSTEDIQRIHRSGKIASLIGLEGGHSIDNSLKTLGELYAMGARYMTLSHWRNLDWVEAATDKPMTQGLTAFGEQVIQEMNRLGMLVDISHVSAKAMRHVLKVAKAPVIASHSSAYSIKKHARNIPDDVLGSIKTNGGVVMVNFYSSYLTDRTIDKSWKGINLPIHECVEEDVKHWQHENRMPLATVSTLVDHIDHIVKVAGIDHVGLGSDFDGVPLLPQGLEDVSKFPNITLELLRRGYSEKDIHKILGENLMRAFGAVERAAESPRKI